MEGREAKREGKRETLIFTLYNSMVVDNYITRKYETRKRTIKISIDRAFLVVQKPCGEAPSISVLGKIPWTKVQQPIPVFLPGISHGQRSLTGYD